MRHFKTSLMESFKKYFHILNLAIFACLSTAAIAQQKITAIVGATIIDVDDFGNSSKDIRNATVLLQDGKIKGVYTNKRIPADARVINAKGKYIIPGLIDIFGALNNQSYANAYLYLGVTTIMPLGDPRRGPVFWNANPSPHLIKQRGLRPDATDSIPADKEKIKFLIDSLVSTGVKVIMIGYNPRPQTLKWIVDYCKKLHLPTIGELGYTSYAEAVKAGVNAFVHNTRYTADILPDTARFFYNVKPFGKPGSFYYDYILTLPDITKNERVNKLANLYSKSGVGLIPTSSLIYYPFLPFAKNLWKEDVAAILNDSLIHEPLDKATGKYKFPASRAKAVMQLYAIDSFFASKGIHYLTGSGADVFGTMPGISLHTEMEIFSSFGMTNRQVLAAATNNFSLIMGWTNIGKVEKGRQADLLVLDGNPLENLENLKKIRYLFLNGMLIDRNTLLK